MTQQEQKQHKNSPDRFLHTHPSTEKALGLDKNHVIVDLCDYKTVISELREPERGITITKVKYKPSENSGQSLKISGIIDKYLPAEGVGTEREKTRMAMHTEIAQLFSEPILDEGLVQKITEILKEQSADIPTPYGKEAKVLFDSYFKSVATEISALLSSSRSQENDMVPKKEMFEFIRWYGKNQYKSVELDGNYQSVFELTNNELYKQYKNRDK